MEKDFFTNLCASLKKDYERTFQVMENGTINATNNNIREVRDFLERYSSLFRFVGLEVPEFNLEYAGQGQIATINKTKKELLKLLGVANQIYVKACKVLNVQPSTNHMAAIFTDISK